MLDFAVAIVYSLGKLKSQSEELVRSDCAVEAN